ncbi:MAG: hypothetical protein WBA68_00915 [Alteraurantiacibacter sp.]
MKILPLLLGAAILAPVGGAVMGKNLGTDPLGQVIDVTASLPQTTQFDARNATLRSAERLPNHYALETPDGIVPVGELAMRGQHRERWEQMKAAEVSFAAEQNAFDAQMAAFDAGIETPSLSRVDTRAVAVADRNRAASSEKARPTTHVSAVEQSDRRIAVIATNSAHVTSVTPDVIDVQAELALQ